MHFFLSFFLFALYLFYFFLIFFRAALMAYWNFQTRVQIGAVSASLQPQQWWIWAVSVTYTTAHGNAGSWPYYVRLGIEPASSWTLGLISAAPQWKLLFFCFLGSQVWHMEVPRLGAIATATPDPNFVWDLCLLMTKQDPLTHWAGPGIKPASSWMLVRFVTAEPRYELWCVFSNRLQSRRD